MFSITFDQYTLLCHPDALPDNYEGYSRHALLIDEVNLSDSEGKTCFLAVGRGSGSGGWPFLVVAQRYSPAGFGFHPGVVVIPQTGLLLLGAGTRLLANQLDGPRRLWEDQADVGFWGWHRHGDFVLMAAELELAAWDRHGRKLWTMFVEPPWEYAVDGDVVRLDVMGRQSSFPLASGPL